MDKTQTDRQPQTDKQSTQANKEQTKKQRPLESNKLELGQEFLARHFQKLYKP